MVAYCGGRAASTHFGRILRRATLKPFPAMEKSLTQLSHLEGFAGVKPFRISEGYPKVFTTGKGVGDLF
jgi:hypothetical protein